VSSKDSHWACEHGRHYKGIAIAMCGCERPVVSNVIEATFEEMKSKADVTPVLDFWFLDAGGASLRGNKGYKARKVRIKFVDGTTMVLRKEEFMKAAEYTFKMVDGSSVGAVSESEVQHGNA
jgi:hypothetical protein